MTLRQVPYFTFIRKYKEFFENHSLGKYDIPEKYILRIGQLERCRIVNSATVVIQTLKKLESSASQFIKSMGTQAWPEEGLILIDKATHGVKVYSLHGLNTIFPRNVINEIVPLAEKLIHEGKIELRQIEKVSIGIYIVDGKQAGLMFPNNKGEVDMNTLFVSEDPMFCEWCSDVFEYFWQDARPGVNWDKLKVVDI